MRILTAADVRAALPMAAAIDAMRTAFIALSSGRVAAPLRSSLHTPGGVTLYMPACITGEPITVVKVVSVYPNNPDKHLPTINAVVLVLSAQTGVPIAMMDGGSLTAIRTGAASGLATQLLAREDSHILAVVGAGVQARTQIEAVCAVRPIREIRIYSLRNAQSLADELRDQYDADITTTTTATAALKDADVIVTATNSHSAVVMAGDVKPGAHINAIGAFTPQMQEIAPEVVAKAKIVVDHRESAWAEAGDLIIARDRGMIDERGVYAELGEIAAGKLPGRTAAAEITFFKSVGNAAQDAAAAAAILSAAGAAGLGSLVEL